MVFHGESGNSVGMMEKEKNLADFLEEAHTLLEEMNSMTSFTIRPPEIKAN